MSQAVHVGNLTSSIRRGNVKNRAFSNKYKLDMGKSIRYHTKYDTPIYFAPQENKWFKI